MSEDNAQFWGSTKQVWVQLNTLAHQEGLTPQQLCVAQRKVLAQYAYDVALHVAEHAVIDVSQISDISLSPPKRDPRVLDMLRQQLRSRQKEEHQ